MRNPRRRLATPPYDGQADLGDLASSRVLEVDDLFPIAEGLYLPEFAELKSGTLKLTAAGRVFAHNDTDQRKLLFKEHLLRFVSLIPHICRVLRERHDHRAPRLSSRSNCRITCPTATRGSPPHGAATPNCSPTTTRPGCFTLSRRRRVPLPARSPMRPPQCRAAPRVPVRG